MNKSGFLFAAVTALLFAFSLAVGLGSFVYQSYVAEDSMHLTPHLLLSAGIFIALSCVLVLIAGFVSAGRRQLSGLEIIAWVLIMLIFPIIGTAAFFLVSPRGQRVPRLS